MYAALISQLSIIRFRSTGEIAGENMPPPPDRPIGSQGTRLAESTVLRLLRVPADPMSLLVANPTADAVVDASVVVVTRVSEPDTV